MNEELLKKNIEDLVKEHGMTSALFIGHAKEGQFAMSCGTLNEIVFLKEILSAQITSAVAANMNVKKKT